jgi:HSP20 family molecular chaperone IbpA
MNETAKDSVAADRVVETILRARQRIRTDKLNNQKYHLIKEIKNKYPIDDFLRGKISNYKLMASIYKLFEGSLDGDCDPHDIIQSRNIVSESLLRCSTTESLFEEKDKLIEAYEKQTKDLKLLSHKLLVDSFNKKYSSLDNPQKILLREYINNVSNTNSFKSYVNAEIPGIQKSLLELSEKANDTVIKIKINETCNQLETLKRGKIVKESHVMSLLLSYELIKELKATIDG